MGYLRIQRGPAAQLNSRGTVLHMQHPHQYTDYAKLAKRQKKPKVVQYAKRKKNTRINTTHSNYETTCFFKSTCK